VKSLANSKISGSRAFIDAGKSKLDGQSQDLLTSIESLMDAVESMRDDVTVRKVRPAGPKLIEIRKSVVSTREDMESIKNYLNTVKPLWKKTWSEELQKIVDEQQFLKHQEELIDELDEDHREMSTMFDNIDELVKKQSGLLANSSQKNNLRLGLREYVPPDPSPGHGGLSTVLTEVKSLAVDPAKRMRAIAQAEKARDQEIGSRKQNEFATELGGFVEQKMLKKTGLPISLKLDVALTQKILVAGGAEEVERLRMLKNEQTLKSMFQVAQAQPLPESPKAE